MRFVSLAFLARAGRGADAAGTGGSQRPALAAQVTELVDGGVFVAVSLNHGVTDGAAFWHLFNTWSHISRTMRAAAGEHDEAIPLPPALERWFLDRLRRPRPSAFRQAKLEHIVRRFDGPPLEECFFLVFPAESVRNLKARANAEAVIPATDLAAAAISSLQSVLAHVWRACRLPRRQETSCRVLVGCRGRAG